MKWLLSYFPKIDQAINTLKNIATILAVIGGFFYAFLWSSHTTFHLVQADADMIKLNVASTGPSFKQSYVRDCRIHFDDLDIEDAELQPVEDPDVKASVVITPDQPKVIALTVTGFRAKCPKTKKEILPQIATGHATLTLSVQESNDDDTKSHVISVTVPAKSLKLLIEQKLPEYIKGKTSC